MCENVAAAAAVRRVESRHLTVVMPSHLIGTHDFFFWFGTLRTLLVRCCSWCTLLHGDTPLGCRPDLTCPTVSKRYNLTGHPRVLLSKYLFCLFVFSFRFVYSTLFSFSSEQRNTPTKCNTNSYYLIVLFVLGKLSKFSLFSNSTKCSIPVLQMFSVCSDWCSCQVCFTHLR